MPTLKAGPIKRIHINGALLRSGKKATKPITIRVRSGSKMQTLRASGLMGEFFRITYRPLEPLPSGAVLWIETTGEVNYV